MNAILPVAPAASLPATLAPDLTRAAELAQIEKAAATRRAYRSDFRIFDAWCRDRGVSALPALPETEQLGNTQKQRLAQDDYSSQARLDPHRGPPRVSAEEVPQVFVGTNEPSQRTLVRPQLEVKQLFAGLAR